MFSGTEHLVWDPADSLLDGAGGVDEALDEVLQELESDAGAAESDTGLDALVEPLPESGGAGTETVESPAEPDFEPAVPDDLESAADDADAVLDESAGADAVDAGSADVAETVDADAEDPAIPSADEWAAAFAEADTEDDQSDTDDIRTPAVGDADVEPDDRAAGESAIARDVARPQAESLPDAAEIDEVDEIVLGVPGFAERTDTGSSTEVADDSAPADDRSGEPPVARPRPRVPSPDFETVSFETPRPRRRRWWLPFALLIGIAALVAQVGWLRYDAWTRDLTLRPYYQMACDVIGCTLPVLRDVSAITTRTLSVRGIAERPGRLQVDAVIVNEAEFAQPFPMMELRFSSIRGHLVAGARFRPAEYLSGELQGAQSFQRNTPVRISLEVDDPGPAAVNYRLDFR